MLIKVSQQPQKSLGGSNQIWAMTSDKKWPPDEVAAAAATAPTAATIIRAIQWLCKFSKPLQLQMISCRFYKFKNRHLEF